MIKFTQLVSLVVASAISFASYGDTSVWKVSNKDDHIYIGGTVHILPESAFPLPEQFEQAYKKSDAIVLEVPLPDPTDQQAQMAMMQAMAYKDGRTLTDVLSAETYQSLADYLAENGMAIEQLKGFKPGLMSVMLMAVELQKAQLAGEGVDAYFAKQQQADKKSAEYLEDMAFQIQLLSSMGEGSEDDFIKLTLSQMSEYKPMFEKSLKAWREGDSEQLFNIMLKPMLDADPKSYKTLMTDRNKNWIPKIEAMFTDQDKEFVLVGAGHLVGPDNVLALLKAKGYTIEQL